LGFGVCGLWFGVWGLGQQPVHVYSAAQPKKLQGDFRIGVWGFGFWFLVFGFRRGHLTILI
jgi:hypothetical protein